MSTFKEKTTKYSSFVNNKNRKKQANIQDTVDICHQKMMDNFQRNHTNIDKWKLKIEKYQNEIKELTKDSLNLDNSNKKKFFEEKIEMLNKNINEISTNHAELDYFYNTVDILVNYYDEEPQTSNKATLLNDYLKITNQTTNKLSHKTILECPECKTEMTVHQHDGLIVCTTCGRSNDILLDTIEIEFINIKDNQIYPFIWLKCFMSNKNDDIIYSSQENLRVFKCKYIFLIRNKTNIFCQ
jgi:uncharacterized protein YbaR (Trm112 family)